MGKYLEDKELDSVLESYFYEYDMMVFQEGIIGKLKNMFKDKIKNGKKIIGTECYECSEYKLKVGDEIPYGRQILKSKSEAIERCLIASMYLGTKDEKTNKIYINKKYEKELDSKKIYLYKVKISKLGNDDDTFKYAKILEIEELTLGQALSHINYEFKDTSAATNKRKQIFSKVCSITKKVFNEMGKEKLNEGFSIPDYKDEYHKEELEVFFNCIEDYFEVFWYDAWDFTNNKARDGEEYEKFNNVFFELMNNIEEELKRNKIDGTLDIYGDWDDGPVVFEYEE